MDRPGRGGGSPGLGLVFNAAHSGHKMLQAATKNLTKLQLCTLSSAGKGWDGRIGMCRRAGAAGAG